MLDSKVGAPSGSEGHRLLLSTALATRREKRIALVIAVMTLAAFLVVVPFVRTPLAKMPAFIPSYEAALFFIDLITAILLYDQFIRVQTRGMLFLAAGYLFDALIIVPHALSFPGAFSLTGLLGAKEQTTAWLYVFWHGGFSLFVLAYAARERLGETDQTTKAWTRAQVIRAIGGSIAAVVLLTVVLTVIATVGHDLLPVVMQGGNYSLLVTKGISPAVWALTLIAMILLWRREQRVMDLWLMLVMWVWLFDIGLSAVIGSNRFDLGFYAGRLFGLIAASFLLVALIVETIRLYSRALSDAAGAEKKLAAMQRLQSTGDVSPSNKGGDETVETFVHRENIARYRTLLKSVSLGEDQRRTIQRLLREEEAKDGKRPH